MIHVCSLARLHDTVAATGARHVVSLLAREDNLERPPAIAPHNHLWLQLHDISAPMDGYVTPESEHVEELIGFVRRCFGGTLFKLDLFHENTRSQCENNADKVKVTKGAHN